MSQQQRPKPSKPPPRLARWYPGDPPAPVPWEDYPYPAVQQAVRRYLYLDHDEHGGWLVCSQADARWLKAYLQYWIDGPHTKADPDELAELRRRAMLLGDRQAVGDWLQDCLAAGLDVLGDP